MRRRTACLALALVAACHLALDAQRGGGGGRGAGPGGGRGAGPGGRGAQDPGITPPVFRSGVTLVQMDAFVVDADGRPVKGLTADDFEVLEDGKPATIASFAAIDIPIETPGVPLIDAGEPDVVTNTAPPGRTYLIALDEVAPDRALRARHFLRRFVQEQLGPNDVAAVALTGRGLASSGQDFTRNKRLLLAAIDKFTGGFGEGGVAGAASSDARQLASGLRQLTEFLATMPGRKVLLYVGEGLGGIDMFDVVDYSGGALTPAAIDAHGAIAAATRGNVIIYPVDPRGLTTETTAAESFDTSSLDTRADLAALADVTGGFALTSSNNYEAAFDRLVRENSTYYTIGFNSERSRNDGRFVRVEVRVKRPGLQVRSRAGYVAPLGQERRPPRIEGDTRLPAVADAIANPIATSGVPIRVFAAPYRSDGRHASIVLAVEMDISPLGFMRPDGSLRGEMEVSYLATDDRGRVRPGRRHAATLEVKPGGVERSARDGVRVLSAFELPRGRYQLRVAAGSAIVAGSVVYDLEVPDFNDGPLSMSGIALASAAAAGVTTVKPHDPLGDVLPVPYTARREFTRDDTLALYAEVYDRVTRDAPEHQIEVNTYVRSMGGDRAIVSTERRPSSAPRRPSGGLGFTVALPLARFAPGRYVLVMEARIRGGASSGQPADSGPVVTREVPVVIR